MLSVRVTHGRSASRAEVGGLIDGVLGHVPVGRPLAAGRRQQAGRVDVNRVVARQRRGQLAVAALDERPDAGEHAQDVVARRRLVQVPAGRLEDELDLLLAAAAARASASRSACRSCRRACGRARGSRTSRGRRGVCGTMIAASPGRNERSNTRWMPWLGAISGWRVGLGQPAHRVGERAGRVDDDARRDRPLAARSPGRPRRRRRRSRRRPS